MYIDKVGTYVRTSASDIDLELLLLKINFGSLPCNFLVSILAERLRATYIRDSIQIKRMEERSTRRRKKMHFFQHTRTIVLVPQRNNIDIFVEGQIKRRRKKRFH